jgi:hypothetical protein
MPTLTRWFIRTSLVYLIAALALGVALWLNLPVTSLQPVYLHLLMLGWIGQLIFGVVFWMFPKYSAARPRGDERLGWATYVLLNAGLVLRAIGEPLAAAQPQLGAGWLLAVAAVLLWLAGALFVVNTWARVKEK